MFKYFSIEEFDCQETGENEMSEEFIHKLDELREKCGFPFTVTSGYRSTSTVSRPRKHVRGGIPKGSPVTSLSLTASSG